MRCIMKKIALTGKRGLGKFALVDDDWFEFLSKWQWSTNYDGYSKRNKRIDGSSRTFFMHRIINQTPYGMLTDHINGEKLDNRKSNLRTVNRQENAMNRRRGKRNNAGFIGVTVSNTKKPWEARLWHKGVVHYLGHFDDILEAALVRDTAALFFRGEFAVLNGDVA